MQIEGLPDNQSQPRPLSYRGILVLYSRPDVSLAARVLLSLPASWNYNPTKLKQTFGMADDREAYELRSTGKDTQVSINRRPSLKQIRRLD